MSVPAEKIKIVEPEPAKEVEVTERENSKDTLPVEGQPSPKFFSGSSDDVIEVLVKAEPVVARPLPILAAPEYVEQVLEEAPVVNSVENIIPNVVSQGEVTIGTEVSVTQPEADEEPVPVVSESVKEPEPSLGAVDQEAPAFAISKPAEKPTNEAPAFDVPESDVAPVDPSLEVVPPVEPESVVESQETEIESEQVPLTISEPVEVGQHVLVPDAPQEEAQEADRPWTPSYTVSSQGGGLDNTVSTDEVVVDPMVNPEPLVEEPAPEIVTPVEVRPLVFCFIHERLTKFCSGVDCHRTGDYHR